MPESFPPRVSCIYQIRCIPTGKIYIGSASNLRLRWQRHLRRLRSGDHENRPLQNAWNKYGEASFSLSVLELVPGDQLLRAEQAWLDGSGCTQAGVGFNLRPIASSAGESLWLTWMGFIDPAGRSVTIENLHAFCRKHDLDFPSMHRLARGSGKLKSYKGWTHENRVRKRPYPHIKTWSGFIDPKGRTVEPITNLAAFSRQHGLTASHMIAVAAGRICSHRGWTHVRGRKPAAPKTYTNFVSPAGERIRITNLSDFCRRNALSVVHMHNVKGGVRRSHKGWTWRP
jgi:group I intron endonuclease